MEIALPLDRMTIEDKFRVLENIWDSLKRTPKDIPVPAWHADVLKAREMRVQEGTSVYGDWADAKRRIRERTERTGSYMDNRQRAWRGHKQD